MNNSLYDESFEHDNCGIGAIVNIKGIKTHYTVDQALKIVEKLGHRAGVDATSSIGDGVGILTQIPHVLFKETINSFSLPNKGHYGVGMLFIDKPSSIKKVKDTFNKLCTNNQLNILGWREVPIDLHLLDQSIVNTMPCIYQVFIKRNNFNIKDIEKCLYLVKKQFELHDTDTYICSLSSKTIVYKGMFLVHQLRSFYLDLQSELYTSAIALVHSRFSTNTTPSWKRAHPNRLLVHNGEINTIQGNCAHINAIQTILNNPYFTNEEVGTMINDLDTDSARLDQALEYMVMSGMDITRAIQLLIQEPFENNNTLSHELKSYLQYNSIVMEPWDGPASILFSDGHIMGATLDRSGLRPSRYVITKDDYFILSSEVGTIDINEKKIIKKDRLYPGKVLIIDTVKGILLEDQQLKNYYAKQYPYTQWINNNIKSIKPNYTSNKSYLTNNELIKLQKYFNYHYEDVQDYIKSMFVEGIEPIIAMGNDTPLAVLSNQYQPLFNYFTQLFAQVTNPPIDCIKEKFVTSSTVYLGKEYNFINESQENVNKIKLDTPILSKNDLENIMTLKSSIKIKLNFTELTLKDALNNIFIEVHDAINRGIELIILSDSNLDIKYPQIDSLLAVSALNDYLINNHLKPQVSIIVESGQPFEVHHFATLLGYGAKAICPYLVEETIKHSIITQDIDCTVEKGLENYIHAITSGVMKIASKMGITTLQSYIGAKNFEVIGIHEDVINQYFSNTVCRLGGKSLEDLCSDMMNHYIINEEDNSIILDSSGKFKNRSQGEEHLYNPETIYLLQQAVQMNDYSLFKVYTNKMNEQNHHTIRSLLEFIDTECISIDEVESVDSIVKRFKTGAMSYGSISKEAHETIAIAMNRLQGKSNSGEGGEEVERLLDEGRCSAIKQIASGRFGVTSSYLCSAKEIQIKMAQGAKPGEGGQLPSNKVYPWIAKTRHSTPGVGLISPPPHHDIYSIEDLAQLIFDLKNVNEEARISVKLVSKSGVGTIASGVAKAGGEVIVISGSDGGTGAAPINSVYHAGLPFEIGLVEAHQTLIRNNLRKRVVLETDGKLMTGRDVLIAAILGAEEFSFASAPLVSLGCVMMKVCNLDCCPIGIATQNPILRKNFKGKPEYIENFMRFIAMELREYMAMLGIRTINELVGQVHLLKQKQTCKLDLSKLLDTTYTNNTNQFYTGENPFKFNLSKTIDQKILLKHFDLLNQNKQSITIHCRNTDRTIATTLGSKITKLRIQYNDDTFTINLFGSVGQSSGSFMPKGLTMNIKGEANDYLAKGLSGGIISIKKPDKTRYKAHKNMLIGNVCLYGATSGKLFVAGKAGDRFAVRNSGAVSVVEGVGQHALEYMTGGVVLILGEVDHNLGAGMSGGIGYVYDYSNTLNSYLNQEMVNCTSLEQDDIYLIKDLLQEHVMRTQSTLANKLLISFDEFIIYFKKIIPREYAIVTKLIEHYVDHNYAYDEASILAFNKIKDGLNNAK